MDACRDVGKVAVADGGRAATSLAEAFVPSSTQGARLVAIRRAMDCRKLPTR